ncbi:MAG: hypothetical protein C0424_04695 [Sphingobacteriaceae bacterium]|nr:hypothetical protein [Sphingobacteriaceae bacterium]
MPSTSDRIKTPYNADYISFMKKAAYIFILGILFSCSKNDKNYLIGEWYRLDEWINTGDSSKNEKSLSAPRPPLYFPFGFEFFENDSIEYFLGIWKKTDNTVKYHGQFRKYKLTGDSLIIYELDNVMHRRYKITFINNDTMEWCNNDTCKTFVRIKSEINNFIKIDSIKIIHRDGWGKNIEYGVTSSGAISYSNYSHQYDRDLRIYKHGDISLEEFEKIEMKYNKAEFLNLTDYSGCCDGDDYTIDIFHNGTEKKRIHDYMNSSPMKFIWANSYLMREIELKLGIQKN